MGRARILVLILVMTASHVTASDVLTIVAPAAPGGGWDQTARVLQQVFTRVEEGTSVQVENVPGAAGTIGLARFVSAERGNPQALLVTGLVMVSAIVTNQSPVTLADATPIARLTGEYEVIVVPAASRLQTLRELIEAFRSAPETVTWGGGSSGGTDDLLVRLIAAQVDIASPRINYVPFAGGGAALAALLGNQVTAGVSGYGEFAGQIASGALRILAVSSATRVAGIDAPTLRESGLDVALSNWRGIVAPPGLTDAERDALVARVERVASSQEWKSVLDRNGWSDLLLTGPAFRQFLLAEQHRVESVLRNLDTTNAAAQAGSTLRITSMSLPLVAVSGLVLLTIASLTRVRRGNLVAVRATTPQLSKAATLVAAMALYSVVMPATGFVPASTAMFAITARLFGSRSMARDFAIALVATTVFAVLFSRGLGVALPLDPLTRMLIN